MNIDQKNKIIIISSPSGAGKTTLCKLLLKKMKFKMNGIGGKQQIQIYLMDRNSGTIA